MKLVPPAGDVSDTDGALFAPPVGVAAPILPASSANDVAGEKGSATARADRGSVEVVAAGASPTPVCEPEVEGVVEAVLLLVSGGRE